MALRAQNARLPVMLTLEYRLAGSITHATA
jgi:hypothetical protein